MEVLAQVARSIFQCESYAILRAYEGYTLNSLRQASPSRATKQLMPTPRGPPMIYDRI